MHCKLKDFKVFMRFRIERDSLGSVHVPAHVYYGVQTIRALSNFPVSGEKNHHLLIRSYVLLKKACAITNHELGKLDKKRANGIVHACDLILQNRYVDQFVIDK